MQGKASDTAIQPLFGLDAAPQVPAPKAKSKAHADTAQKAAVAQLPQRKPPPGQPAKPAAQPYVLPPLPTAAQQAYGTLIGFAICVLLPILAAAAYYGLIASNQYVAEFRFAVKDATSSGSASADGLMALVGNLGGTNSYDNYLVADFLTSRQAVEELEKRINVISLYAQPAADWWSRFDSSQPIERFVPYWQKMVTARYDPVTGLAVAQVRAFSPEEALLIASSLVTLAEELVNSITNRTQLDMVRFSQREVDRAEERLKTVRARLTEYRNRTGVIDPTVSVAASNSTLIQALRATLSQQETQLATLKRQNMHPSSPAITVLNNQITSTREQLQKIEAMVGHDRDGVALSAVVAEYEQLDLERQFAQAMLTGAMQALDQARARAASQHLYITPYVRPHLPQSSTYPHRPTVVATVGFLAFLFWVIGLLVVRSIRERFA